MDTYRVTPRRKHELETDALIDLVGQMKGLRLRVALPAGVACVVAGHLGLGLHVLGFWSVFGVLLDGGYFVNRGTVLVAFLLPIAPIVGAAVPLYLAGRARVRRRWRVVHATKGLAEDWLARTSRRFG